MKAVTKSVKAWVLGARASRQEAAEMLEESVREALRQVIDPELGLNVVDLGLIYGIRVEEGHVHIVMTMTTAGCPAQSYLKEKTRLAASQVPGVKTVEVTVVWSPPWSPEMMSDEGKRWFGYS